MSLREGGKPRKITVRIRQVADTMASFKVFACMQVNDGMYLATISFSLSGFNARARGRWGGSLTSMGTGNKLFDLSAHRAKAIATAYFAGRPVSVL